MTPMTEEKIETLFILEIYVTQNHTFKHKHLFKYAYHS